MQAKGTPHSDSTTLLYNWCFSLSSQFYYCSYFAVPQDRDLATSLPVQNNVYFQK